MISWILGAILIIWCIYRRIRPDGKIEGYPLGMPRGTVRAIITIMIVAFPFNYLIFSTATTQIPGLITNAIFIVVAFYFESRKPAEEHLKRILKEIQDPEDFEIEKKKDKKPLYLPKYTVRASLVIMLVLIVVINAYGPQVPFETTNTLMDLMLIIGLYMIGSFFKGIGIYQYKKKTKAKVRSMANVETMNKYEIIEKLSEEKESWWKQKGKSLISILTLISVIAALMMYTLDLPLILFSLPFYQFSLRQILLLLVSIYYGFRE